jgi:hypothetical protein
MKDSVRRDCNFELNGPAPKAPAGWGSISTSDSDAVVRLKWNQDYLVKADAGWEAADLETMKSMLCDATRKAVSGLSGVRPSRCICEAR